MCVRARAGVWMCAPPFPQTHTLSTTLAAVGAAAVAQVDLSREADNLRRFNENFRRARAVRSTAFCACSACCALLLLCCCLRHILCPMSLHTHRNAPSRAMRAMKQWPATCHCHVCRMCQVSFPLPLYPLVSEDVLVESFERGRHISHYIGPAGRSSPICARLAELGSGTMLQVG